tara:strand:- start:253 stop:597 length:345 start_codon:yes stop_codon:yes gene_type:complete
MRSAFKMPGFSGFGNSPLTQKQKQVKLSKEEDEKGVIMTGGSKSEEAIDLEDRIEFLNNDISDSDSTMEKGKMITQRNKLQARLKKMKPKKGPVKPKPGDMKKYSDLEKYDDDK